MIVFFLLTFAVYLKFLFPTFALGDGGLFSTAAVNLGIVHPPGYPLYALLGKIANILIPLASPAWRLNLLTALFMAIAVTLLVLCLQKMAMGNSLSYIVGTWLALTPAIIGNAAFGEVYSLNLLFLSLVFYLFLWRRWSLAALVYGLSVANHYLMFMYFPAFILLGIIKDRRLLKKTPAFLMFFLLGWALYLYLPLRAVKSPALNWGKPYNLFYFTQHLKRSHFQLLEFGDKIPGMEKLRFSEHFLLQSIGVFPFGFGLLAVIGLLLGLFYLKKAEFFLPAYVFLVTGPGLIWGLNFGFTYVNRYRFEPYLLPCWWSLAIGLAVFLSLIRHYKNQLPKKTMLYLFSLILLALPPGALALADSLVADSYYAYDLGTNIMRSLPENSILFTKGSSSAFSLYHLKEVESRRPDLNIYDRGGVVFSGFLTAPLFQISAQDWRRQRDLKELSVIRSGERSVYYIENPQFKTSGGRNLISRGLVYQAGPAQESRPLPRFVLRDQHITTKDFWLDYERARFNFRLAEYAGQTRGNKKAAREYLVRAQSVGEDIDSIQDLVGRSALKLKDYPLAVKACRELVRINPSSVSAHSKLAYTLELNGQRAEALREAEIVQELDPGNKAVQKIRRKSR